MFGLKKLVASQFNKYSGNKDFIEAVAAASALVAAADGSIDDSEIAAAIDSAKNNPTLSQAYSQGEIEDALNKQLARVKTPSGRVGLQRELDDVAKKDMQLREDVYLAALDVASADGDVSDEEQRVLNAIALRLGINAKSLAA